MSDEAVFCIGVIGCCLAWAGLLTLAFCAWRQNERMFNDMERRAEERSNRLVISQIPDNYPHEFAKQTAAFRKRSEEAREADQ